MAHHAGRTLACRPSTSRTAPSSDLLAHVAERQARHRAGDRGPTTFSPSAQLGVPARAHGRPRARAPRAAGSPARGSAAARSAPGRGSSPCVNETARSTRPASAGRTRSSISRPKRGVPASIRRRSSSSTSPSALVRVEHLAGRHAVVARRDALALAEHDRRRVLLGLDLALRREAGAQQLRAHDLAELGLGQEQEVVVAATQDDERRDHARLRGQQQRLAALSGGERRDLVRDHALEEVGRVRAGDADERARPAVGACRTGASPRI